MKIRRFYINIITTVVTISLLLSGCSAADAGQTATYSLEEALPAAQAEEEDSPYVVLNDNIPLFTEEEITTESFEEYAELDSLGRCGAAFACIGTDLMPTEERGAIGQVKPSGWHTVKYDCVEGKYLYNRCHLIGYQLSGENANERNLITGTRYLNTEGMLPFENEVAEYVKDTQNHVMYRVTPEFEGDNLVASGVRMEAWSVEDEGEGVCFHVFVYNIQPGITIDYATGESWETVDDGTQEAEVNKTYPKGEDEPEEYILNTSSKKFHLPSCGSVQDIKDENKESFNGSRDWLLENGYEPCGRCKP